MERSANSRQLFPDTAKNTNPDRRHSETARRKIECRHTLPDQGRGENLELLNGTIYGRLLINTEMYPCLKRASLSLEAIHLSRIGQMQIKGQEQKKLIESIAKPTGRDKVERYHDKIEGILDKAANYAGLTRTQFKSWGEAGNIDTRTFHRRRSKSKRNKEREEAR